MKILNEFPRDAALGRCLAIKGEHSGRCVDLGVLADQLPRKAQRLVISELAVRGMAGHMGMIDEKVHASVAVENAELRAKLDHATKVIAGLIGALQALGVPVPDEPPAPDEGSPAWDVFAEADQGVDEPVVAKPARKKKSS